MAEAESDDGADPVIGETGDGKVALAPSPSADLALAEPGAKAAGAGPASPSEAGQLMASSRNRSGGVDQGDESIRAPAG